LIYAIEDYISVTVVTTMFTNCKNKMFSINNKNCKQELHKTTTNKLQTMPRESKNNTCSTRRSNQEYIPVHELVNPYRKTILRGRDYLRTNASRTEVKSNLNLSYVVGDRINTYSDGGCREGVCCSVYDNGQGPISSMFLGDSTDAEIIAFSQCQLTLHNPNKELVYHHTDSKSVQEQKFSASELAVEMFEMAKERYQVNILKRAGHPTNKNNCPDYVKRFDLMDKTAAGHLRDFHNGVPKTVVVPDRLQIQGSLFIGQSVVVCRLRTSNYYNVMAICDGEYMQIVLFKGHQIPSQLSEAQYAPDCGTFQHDCRGSPLQVHNYLVAIEKITMGYLRDFIVGYPVPIDASNNSRCKIELLN
jgi:hypothetical protein